MVFVLHLVQKLRQLNDNIIGLIPPGIIIFDLEISN